MRNVNENGFNSMLILSLSFLHVVGAYKIYTAFFHWNFFWYWYFVIWPCPLTYVFDWIPCWTASYLRKICQCRVNTSSGDASPLSIFDVLHFLKEDPKLPVNFLIFFRHFPEGVRFFPSLDSSAWAAEIFSPLLSPSCYFPLPTHLLAVSCSWGDSKVLGRTASL